MFRRVLEQQRDRRDQRAQRLLDLPVAAVTPQVEASGATARCSSRAGKEESKEPIEAEKFSGLNGENSHDRPIQDSNVEDTRKASCVLQHIRDSRFSRALAQSNEMTLRDYSICARQHRLTPSQKAD